MMKQILRLSVILLFNLSIIAHLTAASSMADRHPHRHNQNEQSENGENDENKKKRSIVRVDHALLPVLGIYQVSLGVFKKEHADKAVKVLMDWSGLKFTTIDDDDQETTAATAAATTTTTFLDLVIVKVPDKCLLDEDCDWSNSATAAGFIGIPARSNEPTMQYCCTQEARSDGACTDQDVGHVLLFHNRETEQQQQPQHQQQHRVISFSNRLEDILHPDMISTTFIGRNIDNGTPIFERRRKDTGELIITDDTAPTTPTSSSFQIHNTRKSNVFLHEPGTYVAIFANCHNQKNVNNMQINGNIIWELQPDAEVTLLSQVSAFHISIALGYCTLLAWFYHNLYSSKSTSSTTTTTYTARSYYYTVQTVATRKTMRKLPPTSTMASSSRRTSFTTLRQEQWRMILLVIVVGLVEALLRAVQYHVWAYNGGNRHVGGMALLAMLVGAAKQSLGRHVMLLIGISGASAGVGEDDDDDDSGTTTTANNNNNGSSNSGSPYSWPRIPRRDLGSSRSNSYFGPRALQGWIIVALSLAFFLASASYDFLLWVAEHYPDHKKAAFKALSTVTSYQFALHGIFLIAIPLALCVSIRRLKMTSTQEEQESKQKQLQQYRLLLAIMVGGVLWTLFTFAWYLFTTVDDTEMDVHESNQLDFFVMLTLVAVVCRPSPQHQQQRKQQVSTRDVAYMTSPTAKSEKLRRRTNFGHDEENGGMNRMKLNDPSGLERSDDFDAGGGRYHHPKSTTSSLFSKWDDDYEIDPYWKSDDDDPLPSLKSSSY
jgi:hypothetical protein